MVQEGGDQSSNKGPPSAGSSSPTRKPRGRTGGRSGRGGRGGGGRKSETESATANDKKVSEGGRSQLLDEIKKEGRAANGRGGRGGRSKSTAKTQPDEGRGGGDPASGRGRGRGRSQLLAEVEGRGRSGTSSGRGRPKERSQLLAEVVGRGRGSGGRKEASGGRGETAGRDRGARPNSQLLAEVAGRGRGKGRSSSRPSRRQSHPPPSNAAISGRVDKLDASAPGTTAGKSSVRPKAGESKTEDDKDQGRGVPRVRSATESGKGKGRNTGKGKGKSLNTLLDQKKDVQEADVASEGTEKTSNIKASAEPVKAFKFAKDDSNKDSSKGKDNSKTNGGPKNQAKRRASTVKRTSSSKSTSSVDGGESADKQARVNSKQEDSDLSTKNMKENKNRQTKKDQPVSAAPHAPTISPNQPQQTSDINYGKGDSITILHVAEKPSIATAIAKGLAKGDTNTQGKTLPVHVFTGPEFPKAPHANSCKHRVTSVAGHVFSVDFPQQFQSWDSVDPAELFEAPIVRKPQKGSVVKHLQDEARGVDFIVLWMDCDREGENINFEVLECCMHVMKAGGSKTNFDRVYRAFFSAINPSDIKKAYNALGKPDKNQSMSVDARQELDLKVGVAFSRFQTRYFQGRYGDLDSGVLSYGPCQTPTLGFCVQRHIDIETFKPTPYWVLDLGVMKRGRVLRALWDSGRSFNKQKVEALQSKVLEENPVAVVANVTSKEKKQGRPIPLNTVGLLKACSKALGIGPHSAMQIAERLYLSGYMSYPRTESTAYPKSFDIVGTLKEQSWDSRWSTYVRKLLSDGPAKSRGGVDMGDHPPITPMRRSGGDLSGDMGRVYELVVRHFIASVSPDAEWQSTRIDFQIEVLEDKGKFTLRGKQLVSPGFLEILLHKEYGEESKDTDDEDEEERQIPEFTKGEVIPIASSQSKSNSSKISLAPAAGVHGTLEVREKMTTPPTYLTESDLIGLMEKNGIGTDASIPTHIENIQKRKYVTLETGRRLVPGKLGLVLVQGYHQIDSSLVLPQVRSDIEDQCNKIAKGQATREAVVKSAIELFRSKFDLFVNNITKMDMLFASSFSKLEDVGKPFTRCGLSRRYLQYIPGPPPRLYNKYTETVYPLPAGGIVKQWTGRSCNVEGCGFELCLYSVGQPQRTFPLCPRCFNDVDWSLAGEANNFSQDATDRSDEAKEREIKRVGGTALTLECPLPDHHPEIESLTVSLDPESEGALIVDPHFGPKWRLVSTRAPTIIHMPQSIEKVTILDKKDDVLDVHLIRVDFKKDESPLPDGSLSLTCCFANDSVLQGMVRVYHGSERLKAAPRGGRGRGRGGRGGRGGGRGGRGGRR